MNKKSVSVVIPSYNAQALLEKNIPKVVAALKTGDEVILIDDASTDTTIEWLTSCCEAQQQAFSSAEFFIPDSYHTQIEEIVGDVYHGKIKVPGKTIDLTVFRNSENKRFGVSANIGFLLAKNELVFLCNNDVIPFADTVSKLSQHFLDETVFGVGCLEFEHSKSGATSGKNVLWFERGLFLHARAQDMKTGETAWVSGGSGLFSRNKWLEIGGFDPQFYPAYWEDIDVSFQARARGWKVLFDAEAQVIHDHETTNATVFGNKKIRQMSWKNAFKFTWKNSSFIQKVQFVLWLPYWLHNSFSDFKIS